MQLVLFRLHCFFITFPPGNDIPLGKLEVLNSGYICGAYPCVAAAGRSWLGFGNKVTDLKSGKICYTIYDF